jgi:hypothetical protein
MPGDSPSVIAKRRMEEGCFESDKDPADLLLTGVLVYNGPGFQSGASAV